jgi:PPOX class probable F420-dependent enzyme
MKIISATSETPGMTKEEVDKFLAGNLMLQMATIDKQGEPNIQPVWFYYDKKGEKLLVTTSKLAKKVQNLRNKPSLYFSVDDENFPYKGVKGRGSVNIIEDSNRAVSEGDKISMKYLGTLDHPIAKMITEHSKKGDNVLIEVSPKFFSTWDYSKSTTSI